MQLPELMKKTLRILAGVAILLILVTMAVLLAPTYVRHVQLEQFMEEAASEPNAGEGSDEMLRVAVFNEAARLGIPLNLDQVRVERSDGTVRINVRYYVRIDLPIYTVDLHFRAGSGAR